MNQKDLEKFRELLIKDGKVVSEIEYTSGNYDNNGNLIEGKLPTVTTDFCEVGVHESGDAYFVFVIKSETFDLKSFDKLKEEPNIFIYGFENFNKNLYPVPDFDSDKFFEKLKTDKYLQIQFDFKSPDVESLYKEYRRLVRLFGGGDIEVVNQLEVGLKKK